MDDEAIQNKLKTNLQQPEHFDPAQVLELLETMGDKWKLVWEELPTLTQFDQVYGSTGFEAFIYQSSLFVRSAVSPGIYDWEPTDNPDNILDWLVENPPFECCVTVADLYMHARSLNLEASPWELFILLTCAPEDTDEGDAEMITSTMVPVGINDAVYLGRALESWGEYADVIQPYTDLLLLFAERARA